MKTLLAINPGSRQGNARIEDISATLERDGPVESLRPQQPTDLPDLVRRRGSEADRIVIGGGDGSINLLLEALLHVNRPVGLLPLGTANDLARSLDIPTDIDKALAIIRDGETRRVDVARANGLPFINALGVGLGPRMTQEMDVGEKARFGVFAYLLGIVRAFRRQPAFRARLRAQQRERSGRFLQVTVANGIHYGGGMTAAEDAKLDDGLFDVLMVPRQSRWRLLSNAISFKAGLTRNADGILHLRCSQAELTTEPSLPVTLDGEFLTETPLSCEQNDQPLTIYAPRQP